MAAGKYAGVLPLITTTPSWVGNTTDATRLAAYGVYYDMYWNAPDTYKIKARDNTPEIYIPSARVIVDATNRFLAKDFDVACSDPLLKATLHTLFRRERFWAKFATQKRMGLIKGDTCWHIVANPNKPEGSRISVYDLDPASYFPITDPDNPLRVLGVHIAYATTYAGKAAVYRLTYRKTEDGLDVTTESGYYEPGAWDDREPTTVIKLIAAVTPPTPIGIPVIPVYHIANTREDGLFGSSELRGLENLARAVNQGATDQDVAITLEGLGQYVTTSGPPVDADGNETNWNLGPGKVIELEPEATFARINGITGGAIDASLAHIKFVMNSMQQGAGIPAIAAGAVDVSIAESGIALLLELAPVLAKNADKEVEMLGVYDQMLYDIANFWMPTYEGGSAPSPETLIGAVVGDPLPTNRDATIAELITLLDAKIVSAQFVRDRLTALGYYTFPEEMQAQIDAEGQSTYGGRLDRELGF